MSYNFHIQAEIMTFINSSIEKLKQNYKNSSPTKEKEKIKCRENKYHKLR